MQTDLKSSQLLFEGAAKLGLNPVWETDYGLFSVKLPSQPDRQFFFHSSFNFNGELSRVLTRNKHFTRLILDQHLVNNIPYLLPQSRDQLQEFFKKHQPLICKPLLGKQSQGVKLIKTQKELEGCSLHLTFFEKYIKADEYRCLILQDEVIAMQRKLLKPTPANPWELHYINLEKQDWLQNLASEALRIAKIFQLGWAGIDFLVEESGRSWLLEVNSAPGFVKVHQPDEGESINVCSLVWQELLKL